MAFQNTLMADTGGSGKKKTSTKTSDYWQHVNQQNAVNSAANSKATSNTKARNTPRYNPNSPLASNTLAEQTAQRNAQLNQGGSNGGGGSNYGSYGSYGSYGGSGGYGTTGTVDNTAALAAALQAQKQARLDAINAANSALDQQAEAMRNKYAASLTAIGRDYQDLRNQAEVNRYHAMRNQREALANRGALDSGMGRQETMTMNNNYGNNLNKISLQEAAERADVQNAINEMYANVEQQKAANMTNGLADYSTALQNLINAQYSGYNPGSSAYYQQALSALGTPAATATATPVAQTNTSDNAYLRYLRALGYNV